MGDCCVESLDVSLWQLVCCLSEASDAMKPEVGAHQLRVGYIAARLAVQLGVEESARHDLIMAALLHDVGVFSLQERNEVSRFDYVEGIVPHAVAGYSLLKDVALFSRVAPLVLYHHLPWSRRATVSGLTPDVAQLANLIYLADRIDILIDYRRDPLCQKTQILDQIAASCDALFAAESVAALAEIASHEQFWFDLSAGHFSAALESCAPATRIGQFSQLKEIAQLFCRVVDFRSRYTAVHSCAVATCATGLARAMGMSEEECQWMELAGYLHDIGKIAVPKEILDKPETLNEQEFAVIKRHPYTAYHLLKRIAPLEKVTSWICCHHECPSGQGYPFGYDDAQLSLGARIVAVADVFAALGEPRPYRDLLDYRRSKEILDLKVTRQQLDAEIVALLLSDYYRFFDANAEARRVAQKNYSLFDQQLRWMLV